MNNDQLKAQLSSIYERGMVLSRYFMKYKYTVIIIVACLAVLATLSMANGFTDPARNEERYTEGTLQIRSTSVDQEKIDEISATLADPTVEVDPNFVPNRNNPFAE